MNISRIVLGLLLIVGAGGALVGGTGAFFSDTESSTGNSFTAGQIDLKIDNDSYYNGNRCTNVGTEQAPDWQWQGDAAFPLDGTPCDTSFPLADLDDGFVFFNFNDVKPGDNGEDTISLHVQNDAWACMDLTLTSNDDNGSNEPELLDDEADDPQDAWDGELGEVLEFFWWADDGDNVYEEGEETISAGVHSLIDLAPQGGSFRVALADSQGNVWGGQEPLPANTTKYIAKAWCMGDMTLDPVAAGQGDNPSVDPGVDCDGSLLDNAAQTDAIELTIMFTAVQARHNPDFRCQNGGHGDPGGGATLTVNKIIVADTVGIGVEDFELHINGPDGDEIVTDNVPNPGLTPGPYTVSEVVIEAGLPPGVSFTTTFGGACDASGNVILAEDDNLVCTITNTENEPAELFFDNFGTGNTDTTFDEAPTWEEGGAGASKRNSAGGGDESISDGDGGRKAAMVGPDGYICKSINATTYSNLALSYSWRGDSQAEVGDNGLVQYATGGTCAVPTGLTTVATHPLTTTTWQNNSLSLGAVDNSTFLLFFRAASNAGDEDFRIDAVSVTGN